MPEGTEKMTEEIEAIEAALETEQNMMARQRLLKQRWKYNQESADVDIGQSSHTQDKVRSKQNECNVA